MTYKRLFIFVEGERDELFFRKLIVPRLKDIGYHHVDIIQYSEKEKNYLERYINSIKKMNQNPYLETDYILVADKNNEPCITAKKQKLLSRYPYLEDGKIIIAVSEIESWYLAGLTLEVASKLGVKYKYIVNNEKLAKEEFERLIPRKFKGELDFRMEILNNFSLEEAIKNNKSIAYFIERFKLVP